MRIPDAVYDIFEAMQQRFPLPNGDDEGCRDWMIRFAEQVSYSLPNQGYGNKRADRGRPISNDVLALTIPGGLIGWDMWGALGTPGVQPIARGGESIDLPGQVFVAAEGHNHLNTPQPPTQPPTQPPSQPPAAPAVDLAPLLERLDALRDGQAAQLARLDKVIAAIGELRGAVVAAVQDLKGEVAKGIKVRF